jgi:hypothetical protein
LPGQFLIAKAGFFGDDLFCAKFCRKAKCPEKQGDQNTPDRGVEHGVGQVLAAKEAHDQSEKKADKASDECEVLHGRRVGVLMRGFGGVKHFLRQSLSILQFASNQGVEG